MKTKKTIISIILLAAILFSLYVLILSIENDEWNTVAASLAVTTAIIGSWSAQKIIWKQEEELEPKLTTYLDLNSRIGLTLFVIENVGGSSAYNVKIKWKKALVDRKENEIHFKSSVDGIDFKQIMKGQKFVYFVNTTPELYRNYDSKNEKLEFYGELKFKKKRKRLFETVDDFFVSLEPHRPGLETEDEIHGFYHEGSKIHNDLKEINKTLNKVTNLLNNEEKSNS